MLLIHAGVHNILELIDKNGVEFLLPQNLSNKALNRMLLDANIAYSEPYKEILVTSLFIAVSYLGDNEKIASSKRIEFAIHEDKVRECISLYIAQLRLEEMRRKGNLSISIESFPNLANIFDKGRKVDCHII